jgi:predicted peptidase
MDQECFVHPSFESDAERKPVIVFLHGRGERGNDLTLVERHGPPKNAKLSNQPEYQFLARFRVVAPQCSLNHSWTDDVVVSAVADLLQQLCESPHVDRVLIYLAGWSMRGFGVCSVLACSDVPAAAVVVSGGVPRGRNDSAPCPNTFLGCLRGERLDGAFTSFAGARRGNSHKPM